MSSSNIFYPLPFGRLFSSQTLKNKSRKTFKSRVPPNILWLPFIGLDTNQAPQNTPRKTSNN